MSFVCLCFVRVFVDVFEAKRRKRRNGLLQTLIAPSVFLFQKGVVFVMSGFVNPERGNLRDKALQMGAQYRQDWGKGCTHLM